MSRYPQYRKGYYKMACDICGHTFWNDEMAMQWDKAMACKGAGTNHCWSPRHPQDLVRSVKEELAVPNARPKQWQNIADAYPNGVTAEDL